MRLACGAVEAEDEVVTAARDAGEAAAVLRRLLDAVEAGELDADGPLGTRVLRQLYGAMTALEAVAPPVALKPSPGVPKPDL